MGNKFVARALGSAVLLAGISTVAQAEIVTMEQTSNFGFQSNSVFDYERQGSNNPVSSRTDSQTVNMAGFDSSLGDLIGVDITFQSGWSLGGQLAAWDDVDNYWIFDKEKVSAEGYASSTLSVELTNPSRSEEEAIRTVQNSCSRKGNLYYAQCKDGDIISGDFDESLDLASIDLSEFLDTTLALDFERVLTSEITSCGWGSSNDDECLMENFANQWKGAVTVTYTYDIPEPTTLALFGLGLMGLGLARRNQKA
ncbi:MAG: PEP-CTERM sorting domain-containing protein [Pseudomonadales bacterium]|nr:PEP-CTERM sorting domain-containing protein [Pseudomonadales bacterium]